jgi:pyruvate ferredoxin oxidoreductase delta subunit
MSRPEVDKTFKIGSIKNLPCGTYGKAMQLTETMEGWRNTAPVIDETICNLCNWCYLVCPEGVMYTEDDKMKIDYRFCKGCGICAKECKKKCINMVSEEA